MTGQVTAMVSQEPLRSYESGPNQVLIWVLMQAATLASRFAVMLPESASYRKTVEAAVQGTQQVRSIQAIASMSDQYSDARRPASRFVVEAGRSRRQIYRKACAAYDVLVRIESGDPDAITTLLRSTLLGPLEVWRQYELAVAFSIGEAFAAVCEGHMVLNLLVGDTRLPIARVGRYGIFWQSRTALYRAPTLEPSEVVTNGILASYGLVASSDRPDLVIVDELGQFVVAIVEVKYLTAEDASDRVRGAVAQVVRYSRLYYPIEDAGPLLGRSLVAVNQGMQAIAVPSPLPRAVPAIVDFAAIKLGTLAEWARRALH
jgi:hypothetical protein